MENKLIAHCVLIIKNEELTKFMQCADVFERFKVVADVKEYTMTFNMVEENKLQESMILRLLGAIANGEKNEFIVMAHIKALQLGNHIITNNRYPPYFKGGISVISNGSDWFMLDDYVKHMIQGTDIKYSCNEHRQPERDKIFDFIKK